MKNPLNKRLPRELRSELGKYLVIFLLLIGTIGFVSGFLVADGSMIVAYNESFEKYNIEDGHFITQNKMNKAQQKAISQYHIELYDLFYYDASLTNGTTLRFYANREDVNKVCLMSGKMPQQEEEVAIDRMYAVNNKLAIGDTISTQQQTYRITGLIALSDYSCLFESNNDSMFDSIQFGVFIVTQDAFDRFDEDLLVYSYAWKYTDGMPESETEENLASLKDLLNRLSSSQNSQEIKEAISTLVNDLQKFLNSVSSLKTDIEKINQFINEIDQYEALFKAYSQSMKDEINKINIQEIEENATLQAQEKMKKIINDSQIAQNDKDKILKEIEKLEINGITTHLSSQLEIIKDKINQQPYIEVPQLSSLDLTVFENILIDIENQKNILSSYTDLFKKLENSEEIVTELSNQVDNTASFIKAIGSLSRSIDQMYDTTQKLSNHSLLLTKSQVTLKEGINELSEGTNALAGAYHSFDKNGIGQLRNMAGNDLTTMFNRLKAIQKAESLYNHYSGIQKDVKRSVIFIYETQEIKK